MQMDIRLPVPSLETMTLINIATNMWRSETDSISSFSDDKSVFYRKYVSMETEVMRRTSDLHLPRSVAEKLYDVIRPIGVELMKWKNFQSEIVGRGEVLKRSIECVCWTVHGTVDVIKTVETLMESGSLDTLTQYRLACHFCLDARAMSLWPKLTPSHRKVFLNPALEVQMNNKLEIAMTRHTIRRKKSRRPDELREMKRPLFSMGWRLRMNRSVTEIEFGALSAVERGNHIAVKFYCEKLTPEQKQELSGPFFFRIGLHFLKLNPQFDFTPRNWPEAGFFAETVLYLLRHTNQDTRQRFFTQSEYWIPYYGNFLLLFADWPYQPYILQLSEVIPPYRVDIFLYVIDKLLKKKYQGFKDYDYSQLMRDFWKKYHRFHDVGIVDVYRFLKRNLKSGLRDGASVVLEGMSQEERKSFTFSSQGRLVCTYLVRLKRWGPLKFFLRECLSEDELKEFQESFEECAPKFVTDGDFPEDEDKFTDLKLARRRV